MIVYLVSYCWHDVGFDNPIAVCSTLENAEKFVSNYWPNVSLNYPIEYVQRVPDSEVVLTKEYRSVNKDPNVHDSYDCIVIHSMKMDAMV